MLGVIFIYSSSLFNEASKGSQRSPELLLGILFLLSEAGIGEEGTGGVTQHLSNSEESNSGPHTCEASALTTEISRDR